MSTLWESIKDKIGILAVTTVVSVATLYSDKLTGAIKEELNRADQRPAQQEKIAKAVSQYVFTAENMVEFAEKGLTKKTELHFVTDPYNIAVEAIRTNEYVYSSIVERYWGEETKGLFDKTSQSIHVVDEKLHAFNSENALVESGNKESASPQIMRPLAADALKSVGELRASAKVLFSALSK